LLPVLGLQVTNYYKWRSHCARVNATLEIRDNYFVSDNFIEWNYAMFCMFVFPCLCFCLFAFAHGNSKSGATEHGRMIRQLGAGQTMNMHGSPQGRPGP